MEKLFFLLESASLPDAIAMVRASLLVERRQMFGGHFFLAVFLISSLFALNLGADYGLPPTFPTAKEDWDTLRQVMRPGLRPQAPQRIKVDLVIPLKLLGILRSDLRFFLHYEKGLPVKFELGMSTRTSANQVLVEAVEFDQQRKGRKFECRADIVLQTDGGGLVQVPVRKVLAIKAQKWLQRMRRKDDEGRGPEKKEEEEKNEEEEEEEAKEEREEEEFFDALGLSLERGDSIPQSGENRIGKQGTNLPMKDDNRPSLDLDGSENGRYKMGEQREAKNNANANSAGRRASPKPAKRLDTVERQKTARPKSAFGRTISAKERDSRSTSRSVNELLRAGAGKKRGDARGKEAIIREAEPKMDAILEEKILEEDIPESVRVLLGEVAGRMGGILAGKERLSEEQLARMVLDRFVVDAKIREALDRVRAEGPNSRCVLQNS